MHQCGRTTGSGSSGDLKEDTEPEARVHGLIVVASPSIVSQFENPKQNPLCHNSTGVFFGCCTEGLCTIHWTTGRRSSGWHLKREAEVLVASPPFIAVSSVFLFAPPVGMNMLCGFSQFG